MFYKQPKRYFIIILFLLIIPVLFTFLLSFLTPAVGAEDCCHHECNLTDPDKCIGDVVYECQTDCDSDVYQDWCPVNDCSESEQFCSEGSCQAFSTICTDNDNDGYGNPASMNCSYSEFDCDDADNMINPSQTEICGNSIDEDCDGISQTCSGIMIDISFPDKDEYTDSSWLMFKATALNGIPPYNYNWSSSIDGELYDGLENRFSPNEEGVALSLGNHIVTLTITDYNGLSATKNISLNIVNSANLFSPIKHPSTSDVFPLGSIVSFGTWANNGVGEISYQWKSDIDGVIGNTENISISTLSVGVHTISLFVQDSVNNIYTDSIVIEIKAGVIIKNMWPKNSSYDKGEIISFFSSVSGGTAPYNYSWVSDIYGLFGQTSSFVNNRLSIGLHNITLTVTDSNGNTDTQTTLLEVKEAVCIDADGDGYGYSASPLCTYPEKDCNDTDIAINPGAIEICGNEVDENCNWSKDDCPADFIALEPADDGHSYNWGEEAKIRIQTSDTTITRVSIYVLDSDNNNVDIIALYDDGTNGDLVAGDNIWERSKPLLNDIGSYTLKVRFRRTTWTTGDVVRQINIVGLKPTCTSVVDNGDSADKLDIVFIADQYTTAELPAFETKVNTTKDYLFDFTPFNLHASKINIHRIDSVVDLGCKGGVNCNGVNINKIASICPYDNIVVLSDANFRSYANFSGYSVVSAQKSNFNWVVVHEAGHSLVKLKDEYVESGREVSATQVDGSLNCDTDANCSKWNSLNGTGCFDGCYYNNGYYRSVNSGTMRSSGAMDFGVLNIKIINDLFNNNYN